ncbi:MAG: HD domain-containing protein [Bdellovibrionales bacterium]|nr:HD domain-containing protein [Bdellovibrionales bacterium]
MEKSKLKYSNAKILYVDDEIDNLVGFQVHVEGDFSILTSEFPTKALEMVETDPDIAVMIVDQVTPKMTGLELAEKAKKISPYLTCIMLTGNATKSLAIESVRKGLFWEFLEKPVDFSSHEMKQMLFSAIQEHYLDKVKNGYREGTIQLLAKLIDDKDGHTHRHSFRVQEWSIKIGKKYNLSDHEMVQLREGALLHDIGKISIPDDILKKPGRLTALERKIIMTHPGRGGDLLESIPQLAELASMARDHHERPDGKGYPRGLKADEIPLLSSIVAMADFYEALSSKRPYKEPWEVKEIVKEVARVRGTQFREDVVDTLLEVLVDEKLISREDLEQSVKEAQAA